MRTNRKALESKGPEYWDLCRLYGFKPWQDAIALPLSKIKHTSHQLDLENRIQFTYVTGVKSNPIVYISQKTDIKALLKVLPFLFDHYELFVCSNQLIDERLRFFEQDRLYQDANRATINLKHILESAAETNASDIHIESQSGVKIVRIRREGNLEKVSAPEPVEENLLIKIKLHAGMDISQKRLPQDGHFHYISNSGSRYDLRVSSIPGIYGEKIVIRLLPTSSVDFSLEKLGLTQELVREIRTQIQKKTGMILVTGPTGSGKTTTLYAVLKELSAERINILTIEDPVEYRLEGITQVQVNERSGLTFSTGLRSFLRQDPDVILIGEIRDQETAKIAARAAQTGHLVLTTLHSNNVFEAIHRLKNLGVVVDDLAGSLRMLISQRLFTKLCDCGGDMECERCAGNGVAGRMPIAEALSLDDELRNVLVSNRSLKEFEKTAATKGFMSLREMGEKQVNMGIISENDLTDTLG